MSVTHVVGVDPGLVHTGVVGLAFNPHLRSVQVKHEAVAGAAADQVQHWIDTQMHAPHATFIEGYRTRGNLGTDKQMTEAVAEMRKATHGKVLLNTGVKQVVKQPLMELLGCWKFGTVTHHQDLRSAARIALFGMLKDEHFNKLLTRVVTDHLEGLTWHVHH